MNRKRVALVASALLFIVNTAFALPANKALTVKLFSLSSAGTVTPVTTQNVTSDANGRATFNFTGVPTSDTVPFVMVEIMDGTTVLRQAIVPSPAPQGSVQMGVSEVTDRQAKAMLSAFGQAGSASPTHAMAVMSMVRSGALGDAAAQGFGPAAVSAATGFESYLTSHGVTASQMTAYRNEMLDAMRAFAATIRQSVQASNDTAEADLRGQAMADFMDALVNAGADVGMSPDRTLQGAFDQAGANAEAGMGNMDPAVRSAVQAELRADAQQRQLWAQMRRFGDAMGAMNATTAQAQGFASASTTLSQAMVSARERFEEMFSSPTTFPTQNQIDASESAMATAMENAFGGFLTNTAASSSDLTSMRGTMATRMQGMGGMMAGMNATTLANMGIGAMVTSPGAAAQNWPVMMVAGGDFVTPGLSMTYTPMTQTLSSQLSAPFTPPAPPDFSQFQDPYKSMLELQYDLMLAKFINLQAIANAPRPVSQQTLAQIQEADRATRASILANIGGLSDPQKKAMFVAMSQPEMWGLQAL